MPLETVSIEIEEIRALLPHREPFLFVDRVVGIDYGKKIRALRDIRPEEPHLEGHFPGNPIMPGVLIAEALAQTSGLLIALTARHAGEDPGGRLFYLAKSDVKWSTPARPGDTLTLEAKLVRTLASLSAFSVRAFTKTNDVANGTLTLARVQTEI